MYLICVNKEMRIFKISLNVRISFYSASAVYIIQFVHIKSLIQKYPASCFVLEKGSKSTERLSTKLSHSTRNH